PPAGGPIGGMPPPGPLPLFWSSSDPDVKFVRPMEGPSFGVGAGRAQRGARACSGHGYGGWEVLRGVEETPAVPPPMGGDTAGGGCSSKAGQTTMPNSFWRTLGSMCFIPSAKCWAELTIMFQSMAEHGA